ncbi:c-type cytochrome [Leisingera aquaemixtae]|uniref:Cytochrome c2 n=1 Tax=Leisingera aquaemixtae TaxID=1396826 RepID=A0A0P1HC84_9RHOB|nr:c-type cytochrome [Leisingera aquaemixtae]CUI01203.1 Cytochrome c2 [Leisingera aquaemixtae]
MSRFPNRLNNRAEGSARPRAESEAPAQGGGRALPGLSAGRNILLAVSLTALGAGPVAAEKFGLGRPALPEEIAAWDLDVASDGTGLPAGSGDVFTGEEVFAEKCAVCHGDFAEGVGNWPKLAGGQGTLDHEDPLKTVGSYWPYLSTTWDYVNRSMPFGNAQSLTPDEVYAIVAYILYSNDLVDDEFVLSDETFLEVELPNADGFILDDRQEAEKHFWNPEPCMENCKDSVEITMRAMVLDVTPEEEGAEAAAETPAGAPAGDAAPVQDAAAEQPAEEPVQTAAVLDPELVAQGEKTFKKCKACHQVGDGAKSKTGPVLNGIVGAPAGHAEGFRYSKAMAAAAEDGLVWTEAELAAFLAKPKSYMKGTKMSFAGLKKDSDIEAVIAYLQSYSQ